MKKAAWIALLLALCTALCACQKTTAAVPACRDAAAAVLALFYTGKLRHPPRYVDRGEQPNA